MKTSKQSNKHFKLPKYKADPTIRKKDRKLYMTPDGKGPIDKLELLDGQTFYRINGKYYSEAEIRPD